jgi:hypothetical protein
MICGSAGSGEMEDLVKWRTWRNGGPGGNGGPREMEDLGKWRTWGNGGPREMEYLGKRRTSGTWRFKSFIIQEGKGCVVYST